MKYSAGKVAFRVLVVASFGFVTGRGLGIGAEPEVGELRDLPIHFYNLASVPERCLGRALSRAGAVLASAAINPVWLPGEADAPEARIVDLGKQKDPKGPDPVKRESLVLVLAKSVPVSYAPGALGIAFPSSDTGVSAIVFYDRINKFTLTQQADGPTVLGLAIAHEIGHMLLRSSAHSEFGIMKSLWTRSDLQCAEARLARFTRAERDTIRTQPTRARHS